MGRREVEKRTLNVFLEAVRGSEDRLRDFYRQMQEEHREIPDLFRRQYGGVRRLKDYLSRCADNFRPPMHLFLSDEDENLLASCLVDSLPEVDQKLASHRTKPEERAWCDEQRQLLMQQARDMLSEPLQPILTANPAARQTPSVKAIATALPPTGEPPNHAAEAGRAPPMPAPPPLQPTPPPSMQPVGGPDPYGVPAMPGYPGMPMAQPGHMPPQQYPPGVYPQQPPPGYGVPQYPGPMAAPQYPPGMQQVQMPPYGGQPMPMPGYYQPQHMPGGPPPGQAPAQVSAPGMGMPMPDMAWGRVPPPPASAMPPAAREAEPTSGLQIVRTPHGMDPATFAPRGGGIAAGSAARGDERPSRKTLTKPAAALAPDVAVPAVRREPLELLFDANLIKDHRVRAQVRLDLQDFARSRMHDDLRMSLVHLGSLLEGLLLDYGLEHRKELDLSESPDVWDYHALAVRVLGSKLDPGHEPVLGLLHACRRMLRPSCQIVHPILTTGSMVQDAMAFVRWVLQQLGYVSQDPGPSKGVRRPVAPAKAPPPPPPAAASLWRATRRGAESGNAEGDDEPESRPS